MSTKLEPIPSHFFTTGEFEIWVPNCGSNPYDNSFRRVAEGLSGETALAYQWRNMEIRLNGKAMTEQQVRDYLHKP